MSLDPDKVVFLGSFAGEPAFAVYETLRNHGFRFVEQRSGPDLFGLGLQQTFRSLRTRVLLHIEFSPAELVTANSVGLLEETLAKLEAAEAELVGSF